ncbi:MAG TPA: adenylate/guanylate cyclase domain-containing protein [Candidatus Cybelea sp.]|nr:adenylate/guanylate cyclase domain-containing protein [Candidatus Cybelea sp.]
MTSPALPTGTVAFLFSDIEGSTRRWDSYGDAMRDALRRHDEIMRTEIERRRGYVFKTIGDAFCAAFWNVEDALNAAVGAQRRFASQDFAAVEGVLVRMAINDGDADERSGDYFGTAVNRTARLLSAGHGGQVLLSGRSADALTARLPTGITLRHLGTLPLRDLREPERVYQPIAEGLRSEFKALRALRTPPNNLPRQSTSFIGRYDDAARVEALLDRSAVVTIVGAGGIGKTRLALEVAANRLSDQRDGAWIVDLASITDSGLIAGTILAGVHAEPKPGEEPLDTLLAYLEKRELLLLLDNSEHLVSDTAEIAAKIIAHCPQITILATSRAPLDISSERIYRLAPLEIAPAMRLFVDRAQAADPDFTDASCATAIEKICTNLDGIALAIELAAARVRAMPVETLAAHLEPRLLAGGRDRRPHQQTMRALIDWSYDLLDDDERRALRHCAVFLRGFTLEVADDVCGDGTDDWRVLDLLASLVDKSLVVSEGRGRGQRYRLLEPIRDYARQRLTEAGEAPDAKRRHSNAFARLAHAAYEEWDTAPSPDWLARVEHDLSNFRVAIRWPLGEGSDLNLAAQLAADTSPIFLRLSLLSEAIAWCEQILEHPPALAPGVEARLRYGLSMLYNNQGASASAFDQALRAVALYREAGEARGQARALAQIAHRYATQERFDEARGAAEEALRLARELGDRGLLADALRRGAPAFAVSDPERMRRLHAESVELFRSLGRDDDTARALTWWGQSEAEIGEYRSAAERLTEAKALAGEELAVVIAGEIVACYLVLGDRESATPVAREALYLATKTRHPIHTPFAITYIAVLAQQRDAGEAARLSGFAEGRLAAMGWQRVVSDREIAQRLFEELENQLGEERLAQLLAEGATLTEEEAVARATALSSLL